MRFSKLGVFFLIGLAAFAQADQNVRLKTNLGDIDITLMPSVAPLTVANFLKYVNKGAYNNTIFHRSVPGFIVQTGGYNLVNNSFPAISQDAAVRNEFKLSNTRGTIAMAKLDGNPNSATNQFFFNLADNASNLDNQNGGFTVFAKVTNSDSQAVVDRIASLPVNPAGFLAPFDAIPLYNWRGGTVAAANIVVIQSITLLDTPVTPVDPTPTGPPTITANGIQAASGFGGGKRMAPGSYIEIYGTRLAGTTRTWAGADFKAVGQYSVAPTALDDVEVIVNSVPAYVYFVSPGQVNVQLPEGIPTGDAVPVIIKYKGVQSEYAFVSIQEVAGAILAPPAFKVGEVQYAVAQHAVGGKFVSNGKITGTEESPAAPGETITMYGTGFGPVSPNTPSLGGTVAVGTTSLTNPVSVTIGDVDAAVTYSGLVPGLVGVYQFNVVVPPNASSGDLTLKIKQRGQELPQNLFLTVKVAN